MFAAVGDDPFIVMIVFRDIAVNGRGVRLLDLQQLLIEAVDLLFRSEILGSVDFLIFRIQALPGLVPGVEAAVCAV